MRQTIRKRRCGKWIGGLFLLVLLSLAAFSTAVWAETIKIDVEYPVAGGILPTVPKPTGSNVDQFSRHGWFKSGTKCTSEKDIEITTNLDLCFSINWYPKYTYDQVEKLDYEVTLKSSTYKDVQEKTYKISSADAHPNGYSAEFTISGIKPLVVLGKGVRVGQNQPFRVGRKSPFLSRKEKANTPDSPFYATVPVVPLQR